MVKMLVIAAAIMMVMKGIAAEKIVVGDATGWKVPPTPEFYSSWAAQHNFAVGDTLEFQILASHTVAVVSKDGYDNCNAGDSKAHTQKPTEITIDRTGPFYFICTADSHCANGQKLAINVTDTIAPPPSHNGSSSPLPAFSISFIIVVVIQMIATSLFYY
ncbi:unnamed protein product [Amaranthus hypochondriacus]